MKKLPWKMGLLLALLSAAIIYSFLPQPQAVETAVVTRGELAISVSEDGKTRVIQRFQFSAPISGQLLRTPLRPGDPVVAGQTKIATIIPPDPILMDGRAKAEAKAHYKAQEAAVVRARKNLEGTEQALKQAQRELIRIEKLVRETFASQEALDKAETDEKLKRTQMEAARQEVRVAEFQWEQAKAALMPSQSLPAGETGFDIVAPIDGRVFRVFEENSRFVTPGTALLEIADPSRIEVVVDLLTRDAVTVKPGAEAQFEYWGGEQPLGGRVRLIEPSGFTKFSALGVEEQRVNTILDFTDPPEAWSSLGDGFRVEVKIIVWKESDVLLVPTSALFWNEGAWNVFKVGPDNRARQIVVALGRRNSSWAHLLEGLQQGDRVIVHPSDALKENTPVVSR